MMLYPPMSDLVEKVGSRYLLVNLVARRAREIASDAEANGDILDEKPVSDAINEVYYGELIVTERAEEFATESSPVADPILSNVLFMDDDDQELEADELMSEEF